MTDIIGKGIRVEVAKTMGSAKTVTAISNTSPAVATSSSHGLADGVAGVFSGVAGMAQLEGQAARVEAPDANTFVLQAYNALQFAAATAAAFRPVTAWSTIGRCKGYTIGGGAADQQDSTVLLDVVKQSVAGTLAAQTVTMDNFAETYPSEAMQILADAALSGSYLVFRITMLDLSQRLFYGSPSLPGESVSVGQLGTSSLTVTTRGIVMALPPIAA
jgi:hypothetical protein